MFIEDAEADEMGLLTNLGFSNNVSKFGFWTNQTNSSPTWVKIKQEDVQDKAVWCGSLTYGPMRIEWLDKGDHQAVLYIAWQWGSKKELHDQRKGKRVSTIAVNHICQGNLADLKTPWTPVKVCWLSWFKYTDLPWCCILWLLNVGKASSSFYYFVSCS